MKKLLIVLLLLGITIIFDAESNRGVVYYGDGEENLCIILFPSEERAEYLEYSGETPMINFREFLNSQGNQYPVSDIIPRRYKPRRIF